MIKKTDWNIRIDDNSISFKERLFKSRDLTEDDINMTYNMDYIDINDIDVAVFEITSAIRNNKKIIIFGDYDVDGIMSTSEFVKFFNSINYHVDYHIPNRLTEGYGISMDTVDKIIAENKYDMIITVDNGIAAINQIEKLTANGIKVIVTDHHECKEILPNACAVIDCKRPDNTYPFKELCGAGVVLKVIQALSDEMGLSEDTWKNYLEYAAIATIADVMPLISENRFIVKEGLNLIKKTKNKSILNLLRVSDKLEKINDLTADDIGFYIAPLLNASSRIGSIETAMNLMLSDNDDECIKYSDELKVLNEKRKEIELQIFKEANMFLINNYDFTSLNPIIVYGDNWHKGVIGIVASRLVELYCKPVIILSNIDNVLHGSCRTYGDINIINMLDNAKDTIIEYGGHEGAAGLKVSYDNIDKFIKKVNKYAQNNFSVNTFLPVLNADMSIKLEEITLANFEYLNTFAPFGNGNVFPTFVLKNVEVSSLRKIGQKEGSENAHLKLCVRKGTMCVEGIGFFNSDFADLISVGDYIDIMFKPSINEWQDKKTPQMMISDIRCEIKQKEGVSIEEDIMYREDEIPIGEMCDEYGISINEYIPNNDECYQTFRALCAIVTRQQNSVLIADLDILSIIINSFMRTVYKNNVSINPFKLSRIIEINTEAGYFYYKKMLFGKIILALTDGQNIKRISETSVYKNLVSEREYYNEMQREYEDY